MKKHGVLLALAAAGALLTGVQTKFPTVHATGGTIMPNPIKSSMLSVPGGSIYYEVQGVGPLLLMIPGGATDAGVFADLSRQLAKRYTVIGYDPRGNSRSKLDDPSVDQDLDVHADDAARLIEAMGGGPALVFGSSGGAQIGLNLAARHPDLVRVLVAHEPPCLLMLVDPSDEIASNQDIHDTYRRQGVEAAAQKFFHVAGMADRVEPADAPPPPTKEAMDTFARINGNMEYFFAHGLRPLSLYRPDIGALRGGKFRIVIGVGEDTTGEVTHRTGLALAERLGSAPVVFPGDHIGYIAHAEAFAATLLRALEGG